MFKVIENITKQKVPGASVNRHFSHNSKDVIRVVVTGMGIVSPIGCTTEKSWKNLLDGQCGISKLPFDQYSQLPCKIAAQVDRNELQLDTHFTKSEMRTMSPSTQLALIATKEALQSAKWSQSTNESELQEIGVAVGVGMIDLQDVCDTNDALKKGYNRVSPFFVPRILPNMAAGHISIKYGFRGPNHSVSTACATGAHSIGDAFRFIRNGNAQMMVCGGAEASISPLAIAGFCRLRALSTSNNETPERSSRPFDKNRDGFVMGEGAAILVIEKLEHAKARSAPILAEILGYGLSGDASHLTAPREDGTGAMLAMKRAITDAGIKLEDVSYVNAHATSTPVGDVIEGTAIKTLFEGNKSLAISSTKGAHGHLLGAAGNLEAAFTVLACRHGEIPPTINLDNKDVDLDVVANKSREWRSEGRRIALKNAFGFGGTNACLCIGQFVE